MIRASWLGSLVLSACATPAQMHSEAQLNGVATGCGLALGELITGGRPGQYGVGQGASSVTLPQ